MHKVTIVGAGIAGLTAALRLLERGYKVTVYEQDDFVGGMLRSYHGADPRRTYAHEHSYHMLCNWYHNFWKLAEDLEIRDRFTPRESFRFLYDDIRHMPQLVNPGGLSDFWRNLTGGAAPPAELFLYMYSMIDLLSIPDEDDDMLDRVAFNGWLRGKPYCTQTVVDLHEKVWQTVWAIDSWQASARSYKTFLKYGNRLPVPQLWLFDGSKKDVLLDPLMERLESFGDRFELKLLHRVMEVHPTEAGNRIGRVVFSKVDKAPSLNKDWKTVGRPITVKTEEDSVIIATSPGGLARLVTGDLYHADPGLGQVRYLESEPMAAIEFHLNVELENIPPEVVVLMGTKYQITFLNYGQTWGIKDRTFLYVTVSDFKSLLSATPERRDDEDRLILNLDNPETAIDYVLRELATKIDFSVDDIDLVQTGITTNSGEDLFANQAGSWEHRPEVETAFANMFLAGTYVKNFADVATVEGGCAAGVMAAEAVRSSPKIDGSDPGASGKPIELLTPEFYPYQTFQALKLAWAPYAVAAKAWSMADEAFGINKAWASKGGDAPIWPGGPTGTELEKMFGKYFPEPKRDFGKPGSAT